MRHVGLRTLAVLAIGVAALVVVLFQAGTVDRRPPVVSVIRLSQHLVSEEAVALRTTSLEVVFSEEVDHATAERSFSVEPRVPGGFSWSGTTMIFTPAEPLSLETEYRVEVAPGVADKAGNRTTASAQVLTFATVGRPMIVATDPVDGADEVPVDVPISITFSTLMDTRSVEEALQIKPRVAHQLRWSGEVLRIVLDEPLAPNERYEIVLGAEASDVTGTSIDESLELAFVTVTSGLVPTTIVPANGSEGVAVETAIALMFDQPLDADSLDSAMLTLVPEVAGSLEIVPPQGAAGLGDQDSTVLRFLPSEPLPANTTFEVELVPGLRAAEGAQMATPLRWTFTTGAALTALGNQIVFLSERAGVTNLWAMNPDGTAQRQLSVELSPVLDYALSPDGRSFVVGDGAGLAQYRADGSDRRSLTAEGLLEFDPSYAPDGRHFAFARADAATGAALGVWQRDVEGGDAEIIAVDRSAGESPAPSPTPGEDDAVRPLRAPRYAPDGASLAYVDAAGGVGVVDLDTGAANVASFRAAGPPAWLPDSSGVLFSGTELGASTGRRGFVPLTPVQRLDPQAGELSPEHIAGLRVVLLEPDSGNLVRGRLGSGASRLAVNPDGRIAYVVLDDSDARLGGRLFVANAFDEPGRELSTGLPLRVLSVAFSPEPGTLVVGRATRTPGASGGIWLVYEDGRPPNSRAEAGSMPRWLP